jgi:DUF2946 family protein
LRPPSVRQKPRIRALKVSAARLVVTLFALFAFTLQSFVAQVHVHGAAATAAAHRPAPDKQQPGGGDQTSCPICQLIAHAGHVITPSVTTWAPLALAVFAVAAVRDTGAVSQALSHDWRSRAPPRL